MGAWVIATTAAPRPGGMAYVPALDGLRGLAVLAVLGYHHGLDWVGGGFLGVSLFFTLSGFLITSLLVGEHRSAGRLDLRTFWSRRVRRLAPAAILGIVLALAVAVVVVPQAQQATAFTDIRYALAQLSNWRFVFAETPYANVGTTPSPVLHYWSLAIEEQFYLVLPLLAVACLRRSRRTLAVALGLVTAGALALQLALPATDRVYFGTDTRAAELALGGLLALAWWGLPARARRGWPWEVVGGGALLVTAGLWITADASAPALLGGGLVAVGVVSTGVLAGAMGSRWVAGALAIAPLREIGRISYGVYVFHFPLYLVLTPDRLGLPSEAVLVLRVAASLGVAVVSYRWLERPIRRGEPVFGRPPLRGVAAGVPVAAVLVLLAAVSVPLQQQVPVPGPTTTGFASVAIRAAPADLPGPRTTPSVDDDASIAAGGTDAGPAFPPVPPDRSTGQASAPDPPRVPRVVVVGDSTAQAVGTGLRSWAAETGRLEVAAVYSPGCAVLDGVRARYREGFEFTAHGCDRLFPTALDEARDGNADALLVLIGSPQLADWRYADREGWHDITEPAIGDAYRRQLDVLLDDLATADVPVLWADVPVPDWDMQQFGAMLGGELSGVGEPVINEPERTHALNRHTRALLDAQPGAVMLPWTDGLAGPDGEIGPDDRVDGLHLSEEQVHEAADTWLLPMLADAHTAARDELGWPPVEELDWGSDQTGAAEEETT